VGTEGKRGRGNGRERLGNRGTGFLVAERFDGNEPGTVVFDVAPVDQVRDCVDEELALAKPSVVDGCSAA
jgi:hypothetical protein